MSQLEYYSRITWTDELISIDSQLAGYPPHHSELAWAEIETWGAGRPDARYPEGIYLLVRSAPHYQYFMSRAAGSVAFQGELRARGYPESTAIEVLAEGNRRRMSDLQAEVVEVFGADGTAAWEQLDAEPALELPNVRTAVVRLCKGDFARLPYFIEQARADYRDVLLWAQTERLI